MIPEFFDENSYQPLKETDLTSRQLLTIKNNPLKLDSEGNFSQLNSKSRTVGMQPFYLTLGQLAKSLGSEHSRQFPISPTNVKNILFTPLTGLIDQGYLTQGIEVGVVQEDFETSLDLSSTSFGISGGRHRNVAISTYAHISGIRPEDYLAAKIEVAVILFQTEKDMQNHIFSDNESRRMGVTEKSHVIASNAHDGALGLMNYENCFVAASSAKLPFAKKLALALDLYQQQHKVFRSSKGGLLTSYSLSQIAAKFAAKSGLTKDKRAKDDFLVISNEIVQILPHIASETDLGPKGSVSSHSYVDGVSDELAKQIYIQLPTNLLTD
jgi:hypothetical protein